MYCLKNLDRLFSRDLPINVSELPLSACLVGGAVRDALLNRQKDYIDLDFVVPEKAIETAKAISNQYQGGFVVLDEAREIARVIFATGTLDFARMEGETLETDLKRRDFTVNAIAYNPHTRTLIDPLGGLNDLRKKSLRMVSAKNLADDPLRLLRAYRQAAQLDFEIESDTRLTLRFLAPLLRRVAAERVQSELNYLLLNPQGNAWLKTAWEDGLFQYWLSRISAESIAQVMKVEESAHNLATFAPGTFSFSDSTLQMVKLALLVSLIADEAEKELMNLKYSRVEIRTIVTTLKNIPRLLKNAPLSLREQYFLYLDLGKVFPVFAVFALVVGVNHNAITKWRGAIESLFQSYLDPHHPVAHPQPLIKGDDLIRHLHLKPSPIIGKLLTEVQIAQIEGKVTTFKEAIDFAQQL